MLMHCFGSNGKTNGITLPSAEGQEAVIRKAYAKAGLPTNATDYVEVSYQDLHADKLVPLALQ